MRTTEVIARAGVRMCAAASEKGINPFDRERREHLADLAEDMLMVLRVGGMSDAEFKRVLKNANRGRSEKTRRTAKAAK